jgi:hypothetical protein
MPAYSRPFKFSVQTIAALAEVVTGGSGGDLGPRIGVYRTGPNLERFFGALSIELIIGAGSQVPTVRDALGRENSNASGRETIIRVLEAAVDPRDYLDGRVDLNSVID